MGEVAREGSQLAWVKEVVVIGYFKVFRLSTTCLYNRPPFIAKLSLRTYPLLKPSS